MNGLYIVTFIKLYAYSENISIPVVYHAKVISTTEDKAMAQARKVYSKQHGDPISVIGPIPSYANPEIYLRERNGVLVRTVEEDNGKEV